MTKWITAPLAALFSLVTGCVNFGPPLPVVENVDIERYMGKWYEIARYPNFFEDPDCVGVTAEYALRDDGKVSVTNRCLLGGFDGEEQVINGTARVVDAETNAKLKVSFFGPFEGNYWIIGLDEDYQWAIVGEPSRRTLWILSRTPTLDEDTYADILARLPDLGYDPARLIEPQQVPE